MDFEPQWLSTNAALIIELPLTHVISNSRATLKDFEIKKSKKKSKKKNPSVGGNHIDVFYSF